MVLAQPRDLAPRSQRGAALEKAEAWDPDVARAWNMIFGADTTDEIDRIFDENH